MSAFLYIVTILIWGTSWIMFELQTGEVAAEVSTAYRFGAAAILMFAWAGVGKHLLRFNPGEHAFLALQGALMFSLNIFFFYVAALYLPSGLNAVVFSMSSIIIMFLTWAVHGSAPGVSALMGGFIGVGGVAVIFWPAVARFDFSSGTGLGLFLAVLGTLSFSFSMLVGERNQKKGLAGVGGLAWAMLYGTLLMVVIALVRGNPFIFETRLSYVGSLAFLVLISTVIAFAVYFALLKRIGAAKAAYATVLFPVVALINSTLFESYEWTVPVLIGVALTIAGNFLVLRPTPTPPGS